MGNFKVRLIKLIKLILEPNSREKSEIADLFQVTFINFHCQVDN